MIGASATLLFFFLASAPAWGQFDKMLKGLGNLSNSGSGLSDAKIGSGLQEALEVGTENAVVQTGTTDGFLMNQAIKILDAEIAANHREAAPDGRLRSADR